MKMKQYSVILGIIGTLLLIVGIFLESGTFTQKLLFSIGNILLLANAIIDGLKMFITLELVVNTGSTLAYFPEIFGNIRFGILVGLAIIGVLYLIKKGFFRKYLWEIIGAIGLILLAIGFSTDPQFSPILFNSALGFGSILMATYSIINYLKFKNHLSLIFFVLNIIFAIPPIIYFF